MLWCFVVCRDVLQLRVLDLSNNVVEEFDTQELPHNLAILNLASNPCCKDPDLRRRVTCTLPGLMVRLYHAAIARAYIGIHCDTVANVKIALRLC